jgi:GAF domain-containing protein
VSRSVLDAIAQAAVEVSGAARGWVLRLDGAELQVVAAAGERPGDAIGLRVPADAGTAGFAIASGQPLAAAPRPGDDQFTVTVAVSLGIRAASVLCVPCGTDDGVLGALEVIDKQDEGRFTIDDVELVTLLGGIAGAALADADASAVTVSAPEELAAELRQLASADPTRYESVASVVSALLARG